MPSHTQRSLPIHLRDYQSRKITTQFTPATWDKLRFRALKNNASPDGFIKQILNKCIALNALPSPDKFNQVYPITKSHPASYASLTSTYPPVYLRYIDNLIETLPPIYTINGRSRRRMVEALVLIELNDTGDLLNEDPTRTLRPDESMDYHA